MTVSFPAYPIRTRDMTAVASLKEKNYGLTEPEFESMLSQLEQGDESFFEKIFLRQFWPAVRKMQTAHSVSQPDAEDAVMDALLQFRKLLIARKVAWGNLEAYFMRIVVTGYYKKQQRNKEIAVESFSPDLPEEEDSFRFSEAEMGAFQKAWESLCEKCSTVLRSFYYDEMPHQRIAEMLGKRLDAVKQDKHRCIEKLRKQYFQALQQQ